MIADLRAAIEHPTAPAFLFRALANAEGWRDVIGRAAAFFLVNSVFVLLWGTFALDVVRAALSMHGPDFDFSARHFAIEVGG